MGKTNACIVDYSIPEDHVLYDHDEYSLPGKMDYIERGWNHPQYAVLIYPMVILDHLNGEELTWVLFFLFMLLFSTNPPSLWKKKDKSFTKLSMGSRALVRVNGQHSSTLDTPTLMSKTIKKDFLEDTYYQG